MLVSSSYSHIIANQYPIHSISISFCYNASPNVPLPCSKLHSHSLDIAMPHSNDVSVHFNLSHSITISSWPAIVSINRVYYNPNLSIVPNSPPTDEFPALRVSHVKIIIFSSQIQSPKKGIGKQLWKANYNQLNRRNNWMDEWME